MVDFLEVKRRRGHTLVTLKRYSWEYDPQFQEPLTRLREATSLALMVMAVWTVVRVLAVRLLEEVLTGRAQQSETWPVSFSRWATAESKGFRERVQQTLFGVIRWRRRVGRVRTAVRVKVALDQALGVLPHQRTGGSAMDGRSVGGICAV